MYEISGAYALIMATLRELRTKSVLVQTDIDRIEIVAQSLVSQLAAAPGAAIDVAVANQEISDVISQI